VILAKKVEAPRKGQSLNISSNLIFSRLGLKINFPTSGVMLPIFMTDFLSLLILIMGLLPFSAPQKASLF
jgi:hypothetical protein